MPAARTHRSNPRQREIRAAKRGNARDAIGTLTPGYEAFVLTFGQFSLIDALVALLEQTGPADVTLSTWTAADADLTRAAALLANAEIRSLRFVVDRSFLTRQPKYCAKMRDLFGDDCIRTTRSHAKFAIIRNERWSLAVRTSMNLNENPRLENIEISDDPTLCAFLEQVVADLFEEQQPGLFGGELPELASVANVPLSGSVQTGSVSGALRTATVGPLTPSTSPATT